METQRTSYTGNEHRSGKDRRSGQDRRTGLNWRAVMFYVMYPEFDRRRAERRSGQDRRQELVESHA